MASDTKNNLTQWRRNYVTIMAKNSYPHHRRDLAVRIATDLFGRSPQDPAIPNEFSIISSSEKIILLPVVRISISKKRKNNLLLCMLRVHGTWYNNNNRVHKVVQW